MHHACSVLLCEFRQRLNVLIQFKSMDTADQRRQRRLQRRRERHRERKLLKIAKRLMREREETF